MPPLSSGEGSRAERRILDFGRGIKNPPSWAGELNLGMAYYLRAAVRALYVQVCDIGLVAHV
jgi:hypothetical protein